MTASQPPAMSYTARYTGTPVVAGRAHAPAVWVQPRPALPTAQALLAEEERAGEYDRFVAAAQQVAARLTQRSQEVADQAAAVLQANAAMALDRGWHKTVRKNTQAGHRAEYAAVLATDKFVAMFEAAGGLMAERTTDLKDIRDRVIAQLRGEAEPGLPYSETPVVLLADDLAPADTATLNPEIVTALVTELGGPTSHTAIIARQLNIPAIVAVGQSLREISAGEPLFIDGELGTIDLGVDPHAAATSVAHYHQQAQAVSQWQGPGATADGKPVQLLANVADGAAARAAASSQAEGIGLYRTELSFLSASTEPDVAAQAKVYGEVFAAFPQSKVVVRTLDAGSDKPISYATLSSEDNPALGVRGVRIARGNEGLLTRQLDAIAEAAAQRDRDADTWVMAPMIATAEEAAWFAQLCRDRGLSAGAMIEVPAAALMVAEIIPHLDFVSIGTNDLTQYTMAADRLSPQLAYLTDPWQPAVLRLIDMVGQVAQQHQVPVGVCGEAAADPLLAAVLVGLGVSSLSMASPAVAAVGAQLAQLSVPQCQQLAAAAVRAPSAAQARHTVRELAASFR